MSSIYPTSGPFGTVLDTYFSSATALEKQNLWDVFVLDTANQNLANISLVDGQEVANPTNVANLSSFTSFVKGLALTPYPTTGPYGSILQSFLGTFNDVQKQQMWDSFLENQGLASNPVDASQAGSFLDYVQKSASWLSSGTTLSPAEIQKRTLMVTTFESVLSMLVTLQNTVAVQAKNLVFYSKLQQQYTLMLTGTPVYSPSEKDSWVYNTTDATKFTFGYDNISVDDIATYMAQAQANGLQSSTTFQLTTTPAAYAGSTPLFVTNSAGAGISIPSGSELSLNLSMSFVNSAPTLSVSLIYTDPNSPSAPQTILLSSTPITQATTEQIKQNGAQAAYKQAWSTALMSRLTSPTLAATTGTSTPSGGFGFTSLTTTVGQSGGTPPTGFTLSNTLDGDPNGSFTFGSFLIPWRATIPFANITDANGNINTQEQQANSDATRLQGQYNALMQQYITNTRAQRQTFQNLGSAQQLNMNTSQQNVSSQANILTTMLQTIQAVMSAVFR